MPLAQRFKPRGVEEDSPHWPEFAYLNADLGLLPPEYFSTRLCILDFDQAFLANDPPRAISNIPLPYLAPESIFTLTNGPAADIWALGSILFCLRDTCHLFQPFTFSTIEGTVMEMCTLLGLPPKEWWKVPFHDGLPIHGPLPPDMEHYYLIQEMDDNSGKRGLEYWVRRIKEPVPASESTPKTAIQQLCLSVPVFNALNDREEKDFEARHMTPIQEKDADLFFDLLRKIFTYDRHKRATAEQILEHPWLKDSGKGHHLNHLPEIRVTIRNIKLTVPRPQVGCHQHSELCHRRERKRRLPRIRHVRRGSSVKPHPTIPLSRKRLHMESLRETNHPMMPTNTSIYQEQQHK